MDNKLETIYNGIIGGELATVEEAVQVAVDAKLNAREILEKALIPAMGEVGRLFEDGEYFVPEMLIAARAMQAGMKILKPKLVDSGVEPVGKVVLGTVQGDLHDIGKNLVGMMLEGAGFEIVDIGTDVTPDAFVAAAQDGTDIIGLSALLTTTMPSMEKTIEALEEAGLRDSVKVLVGGAPVTEDYANQIGADGYAPDAGQAAKLAKGFILHK